MTKIIEITNCGDCPFCNNDNEYGRNQCNLYDNIYLKGWQELPENGIHKDCPLKKDEVIVGIKMETVLEKAINKFDTLTKIIDQLEMSEYECEGGCLKNNVAFISLKRMAKKKLKKTKPTLADLDQKDKMGI